MSVAAILETLAKEFAVDKQHAQPEVVARLTALAEQARQELGDLDHEGIGQRRVGRVERPQPQVLTRP